MKPNQFWFVPILVLVQGLFLGSTFHTSPQALGGLMLAAIIAFLMNTWQKSDAPMKDSGQDGFWASTRRARILLTFSLVCLATLAWRLAFHIGETFNPVALSVDAIAHVSYACTLVLLVLHPKYGDPTMLGLGLLLVMLCIAAGGASHSINAQTSVAVLASTTFLFASRFILNHRLQRQRRTTATKMVLKVDPATNNRIGWLFSMVTISMVVIATSAFASTTHSVLPDLQQKLYQRLKSSFDTVSEKINASNNRYVRGGRLGGIRRHMSSNPDEIALRVYAKSAPGYLRGTAFDWYINGHWNEYSNDRLPSRARINSFDNRQVLPSGFGKTPLEGLKQKLRKFKVYPHASMKVQTMELQNDPLKGHVYFSPLGIRWVEANAKSIGITSHDLVDQGINPGSSYVIGVTNKPRKEVLEDRRKEVLLYIAPGMDQLVKQIAGEVCKNRPTSRGKAAAISAYFQREYTYSLSNTLVPSRTDPLVHFLETKHGAHCEYFATATVLMLRSQGIPARYVTGYVATEYQDENEYWLARNRDAHAWAEAYDKYTETWFPVEATPGRTYQTLSFEEFQRRQPD